MDQSTKDYHDYLSGDPDGLSRLVRDYKDGLILYINGIVQNITAAEDLTEDVFVKLIINLSDCFVPQITALSSVLD